ncbi:MAG: Crp/Fnr family transcriptional regulator [Chloroflexota bacterium]
MAVELDLLKTACYFSELDRTSLEAVKPYVREKRYPAGEVVVREGEEADSLHFVISGLLKLVATSAEGREFIVRTAYGGDTVNDDAVFRQGASLLGVVAMSPVLLYGIGREDLFRVMGIHPQVAVNISRTFAAHQRYLVRLAAELVFKGVTARLARLLLDREKLAARSGTQDLRITQQEMAAMIGTVREIVSRSLRELEDAGAIRLERNQLVITDRAYLEGLTEG